MVKVERNDKLFDISNVQFGWLTMSLSGKIFIVSYLTDFLENMKAILNLSDENDCVRLYFDGEGIDLYLTCYLHPYKNRIFIVWEEYGSRVEPDITVLEMDYDNLCRDIKNWFRKNKRVYDRNFGYLY